MGAMAKVPATPAAPLLGPGEAVKQIDNRLAAQGWLDAFCNAKLPGERVNPNVAAANSWLALVNKPKADGG